MIQILPSAPLLWTFVVASFILAVTPGPGVFYIITRSLAQGRLAGLSSVAGVALGNFGNCVAASLGLAALFALSDLAFSVVKYAGSGYLIYLGIASLRREPKSSTPRSYTKDDHSFRDGLIVALLNPKTALFFAAFLPQFVGSTDTGVKSILLGAIFVLIAASTDSIYALTAGTLAPHFSEQGRFDSLGKYISAAAYIGLGLFTAVFSTNASAIK